MKNLIVITNEEMTISHRIVAEQTANQEISIRKLINKYISDFEVFGKVHFKNASIQNAKNRINEIVTYYLNEQQAYLLLTYLRNNEIVRNFKVALVKAFFEMRERLYPKNTFQGKSVIHTINGLKSGIAVKDKRIAQLEDRIQSLSSENEKLKINSIKANDNTDIEISEKMIYTKEDVVNLLSKGARYDRLLQDYYKIYDKYDSICITLRLAYPQIQALSTQMERMQVHIPK
ncbi:Rha family transcriptional regulator [Arcobacter lacus]|uniref:Rha family transcriptional regulator n=1 Tax=Arcobacter lacus TaxID=1912876 RepID=UPI0021BA7401|nr:Rha family transcriptional regulator [Arcobacter lacus]MCT7911650.1 Rha family transcriptional regulator [Arcobacter lacus]